MVATSILPHVVYTVFQYILPPNLPIPQHLLSKRLSQRHHFLSISPTDPAAYLCWPSSTNTEIVDVLQNATTDMFAWEPQYEVCYTMPDHDTVLAHVRPDPQSPLQVVFLWDAETETWRYHDTRMLPFPSTAKVSLDDVLATVNSVSGSRSASPSSDNDNYWEGYASSDNTSQNPHPDLPDVKIDEDKAEAAYWASYGVVHAGSGDSTVPSPRPDKKNLAYHDDVPLPSLRGPDTTFDPFVANLHLRLQRESESLSLRGYTYPDDRSDSPLPPPDVPFHEEEKPPLSQGDLHECEEAFPDISQLTMVGPNGSDMVCNSLSQCATSNCAAAAAEPTVTGEDTGEAQDLRGLKEAVRGLYSMWKAQTGDASPELFVRIVKEALE